MPEIEKFVNVYRTQAQFPSVSSGYILKNGICSVKDSITVLSSWTQRNLERTKNTKFQQTHVVNLTSKDKTNIIPTDTSNEVLFAFSKSEKYRAVIREVQFKDLRKFNLEIWNHYNIIKNISLDSEIHGDVYSDNEFGSFVFSNKEDKVLYIAEKKVPKSEPFYRPKLHQQEAQSSGESSASSKKPIRGGEYLYRQDWGEQLVGKIQSVVVEYDLSTDAFDVKKGIRTDFCPGQVVWAPDDNGFVGVAWKTTPRKLGLIFCTCRTSHVFHLDRNGQYRILSSDSDSVAARCPRFSPDGKILVWLERSAAGPHHACMKIVKYNWETDKRCTVIDVVDYVTKIDSPCREQAIGQAQSAAGGTGVQEESAKNEEKEENERNFYGFFNLSFPKRCWLNDNHRIVVSTPQRFEVKSYIVDLESSTIRELKGPTKGSLFVLDTYNDILLCAQSSLLHPSSLLVTRVSQLHWISLTLWQNNFSSDFNDFVVDYISLDAQNPEDAFTPFGALYFGPKTGKPSSTPLLVWPHGGPHSAFSNSYNLIAAFFVQIGYACVLINYRGSIGHGNVSVNYLPGKAGHADVSDCMQAVQYVCDHYAHINAAKLVLYGGSHGGFLVAHLSGQYPSTFRAVVSACPVTDLQGFAYVTDIPDWAAVEAGFDYETLDTNNERLTEVFNKMRQISPLAHAHKIIAPTLLLIGKQDLRVPPSQGLHFYHRLKANNVKTILLFYDDNHSLSSIPAEMDALINSAIWFHDHTL